MLTIFPMCDTFLVLAPACRLLAEPATTMMVLLDRRLASMDSGEPEPGDRRSARYAVRVARAGGSPAGRNVDDDQAMPSAPGRDAGHPCCPPCRRPGRPRRG